MLSRNIIFSCRRTANQGCLLRSLATEVAQSTESSFVGTVEAIPTKSREKKASKPTISTAVILNRSPILTRLPTPFEKAFYTYQARIRRSLHNPFPYDFYFKQGSLLETRFNMEESRREMRAFGPDFIKQERMDSEKALADRAAVEQLAQQEGEGEGVASRRHHADDVNDVKSLDRKGKRNLYLLLCAEESGKDIWRFPQGGIQPGDFLHQAAQKDLYAECGEHMDAWIVSRTPAGVYKPLTESSQDALEHVVFFFKGHILAGQARTEGKTVKDFAWLTKQEIEPLVEKHYWEAVKNILSDF